MAQRGDLFGPDQLPTARSDPQEYLTDVLARLPSTKITQIHDLLPAHWKPPSADTS